MYNSFLLQLFFDERILYTEKETKAVCEREIEKIRIIVKMKGG